MVHEPIYLDLSSSDEDDDDHKRGSTALLYLAKVFHVEVDDDDDVRIIDKPPSNNGNKVMKRDKPKMVRTTTLDDDDCCILDTDPGADDASPDVISSLNTDELVMTGEKGPVACRDFPHARYLCVHFPFKSTLHSKFCAQCHCYVCDSLAPCSHWGEGNSPDDHCNASEEPRWKSLRKEAKYGPVNSIGGAPTTGAAADPKGGGNRIVQATLVHKLPPPPTPSPLPSPAATAAAPTATKVAPFTIHLKGKGRGKISQLPPLGVRNPQHHVAVRHQKANLRKSAAECLVPPFPSPSDVASLATVALPPNPTPNPTKNPNSSLGRVRDEVPATATITTTTTVTITPHFRSTMQNVNIIPNRGVGAGAGAGGGAGAASSPPHTRSRNARLNRARGVVAATQPTLNPDAAPSNPIVSAPPQNFTVSAAPHNPNTISAAAFLPPPPVPNQVLNAPIPSIPAIPDRAFPSSAVTTPPRYPMRENQHIISEDTSTSPNTSQPPPGPSSDFATSMDFNDHNASSSSAVDIVVGSIEGWEMEDSFAAGICRDDASEQMGVDHYLWEPNSDWQ